MNEVNRLKNCLMIGQIDPWRAYDNGDPVMTLLVSVEIAMAEVEWKGTRTEFLRMLSDDGVLVFRNVNEFSNWKESRKKEKKAINPDKKKFTRKLSEERLNQLKEQAKLMNDKIKAST